MPNEHQAHLTTAQGTSAVFDNLFDIILFGASTRAKAILTAVLHAFASLPS